MHNFRHFLTTILVGLYCFTGQISAASASPAELLNEANGPFLQTEVVNATVVTTRIFEAPYKIYFRAFGEDFHLNLRRPSSPIFSDDFQFDHATKDEDLVEIENHIFVDPNLGAALEVRVNEEPGQFFGTFQLNGFVRDFGLTFENGILRASRPMKNSRCGVNHAKPHQHHHPTTINGTRAFETHRGSRQGGGQSEKPQLPGGFIEVTAIFDSVISRIISKRGTTLAKYAAAFFSAINLEYYSLTNPKLRIRLIRVRQLEAEEEKKLLDNIECDINKMPIVLTSLIGKNSKDYNPSDVVTLITGQITLDPELPEENGDPGTGTTGIAQSIPGACVNEKGSITRDYGAVFTGVHTCSHEIGHTLGAYHDFPAKRDDGTIKFDPCPKATYCPKAKTEYCKGNIMDYDVSKTDTIFSFSQCSQDRIYEFANSLDGKCLFKNGVDEEIKLSQSYPGFQVTLTEQCAQFLKEQNLDYVPENLDSDVTPSCVSFDCPFTMDKDRYTINMYPAAGTPCKRKEGPNGRCYRGLCIKPAT